LEKLPGGHILKDDMSIAKLKMFILKGAYASFYFIQILFAENQKNPPTIRQGDFIFLF